MYPVVTLDVDRHEPVPTCHFHNDHGTQGSVRFGGSNPTSITLGSMPDGDLIVWLRGFADELNRHADAVDGRRLADQARTQAERAAYDADLASLRLNSPLARSGGECS